jgi:hypothetical protein
VPGAVGVTATPARQSVSALLRSWRYTGEPFAHYTIAGYADVVRLHGEFLGKLTDRPDNREEHLRAFLTNLELLQVAIGQLHELTLDRPDSLSAHPKLLGGLEKVCDGFRDVSACFPAAALSLNAAHTDGYDPVAAAKAAAEAAERERRMRLVMTFAR